jgi:beta-glucoside operon transcriptional antiterminator
MHVKMPSAAELSVKYPVEVEIGKRAVKLLEEKMHIGLGKDEAVSIALHFIDAEMSVNVSAVTALNTDAITEHILSMIEGYFEITIDRDGFNCARFETHLSYLYGRIEEQTSIQSENEQIYALVMKEYPKAYDCSIKIKEYFSTILNYPLTDEEVLYLMLHINRLCTREIH